MIQIFSITLAANEAREAAVSGEYFELRNAPQAVALVELLDRSGGVIARLENPEQSDYCKPGRYETIRITNGPTAQTVRHFYGSGDAGSRRTSGLVRVDGAVNVMGDVAVIDGGKSRTIASQAFFAYMNAGTSPGNWAHQQLLNPTGSGKNLFVKTIYFSASSAGVASVRQYAVPLATLVSTGGAPKRMGGVPGVAQLRTQVVGSQLGTVLGLNIYLPANTPQMFRFDEPIQVPPGFGLVTCSVVSGDLPTTFEYIED